ncbi:MAG: hypothetical protein ACK4S0_11570, partial [Sediminibacterium sp.]
MNMRKRCKINVKTMLPIVVCAYLLILTFHKEAGAAPALFKSSFENILQDTVPPKSARDTSVKQKDSLKTAKTGDSLV